MRSNRSHTHAAKIHNNSRISSLVFFAQVSTLAKVKKGEKKKMLCKVQLCVLLCLGAYLARASTPECSQPCNLAACSVVQCRYGTVLDLCGCCSLCGKGPGERCAANFESITFYGVCGDGLVCISPFPDLTYFPGTCTAVGKSTVRAYEPLN